MIAVYVSCPFQVGDLITLKAASDAVYKLTGAGLAAHSSLFAVGPEGDEQGAQFYLTVESEWIMRCDVMLSLPEGITDLACKQTELAEASGMPVFYSVESLLENLPSLTIQDGVTA